MNGNKIENYKIIGLRDMNMNENLETLFDIIDPRDFIRKPYFNDAKETFINYSQFYDKFRSS